MSAPLLARFQGALMGACLAQDDSLEKVFALMLAIGDRYANQDSLTVADWQELKGSFPLSGPQLILATLPLQLRYCDYRAGRQRELETLATAWSQPQATLEALSLWSQIITLVLTDQPLLKIGELSPSLAHLGADLEESLPYPQILEHFRPHPHFPLLAALASFIPTPAESLLCLLKAQSAGSAEALALTGVLCGAYQGLWGLPLAWRLAAPFAARLGQMQAGQLFARWAGVEQQAGSLCCGQALGLAGTIQKREGLRLISWD